MSLIELKAQLFRRRCRQAGRRTVTAYVCRPLWPDLDYEYFQIVYWIQFFYDCFRRAGADALSSPAKSGA